MFCMRNKHSVFFSQQSTFKASWFILSGQIIFSHLKKKIGSDLKSSSLVRINSGQPMQNRAFKKQSLQLASQMLRAWDPPKAGFHGDRGRRELVTSTRHLPLVPMEKKFTVAQACSLSSLLFPQADQTLLATSQMPTPATSTMSNLLYTLISSTTTHVSYMEVSTTHALHTSWCPPRVLDRLTAVFSTPVFSRFRGKPEQSLAWP